MSIYDNAGVALIPSGTKASKLYSVLPANGDGDFTHSRGSTATRVNKDGLIETVATNVPRLDYPLIDGVVQDCPALLLEPQRTNLQTSSEEFNNSTWTKSNVSITADNIVSPNGSQTADLCNYIFSASYINSGFASTGNTDVTVSVFVKANTVSTFRIRESFYIGSSCLFDLSTGSAGSGGTIQEYSNDWYRCTFTYTLGSGQTIINYMFDLNTNVGSIYLWGAMVELGSYPTSYIPNLSTGTTTRSADVCNGSGTSAEFNDSEGVLFVEFKSENDGTFNYISVSDGGTTNYAAILCTDVDNQILYRYYISGSGVAISSTISDLETFNKIAVKWKINDFALWVNGYELNTSNSGSVHSGSVFDELSFARGSTNTPFYGDTKQMMTFKTALNDSELETLTSWDSFNAMAKGQLYTIE